MVPKINRSGKSFQGLCQYLNHDPKADTDKRVAWTHTLNCAHDHVPSAIHEMYTTALDAELLKEEAGVRAGGRPLEKPVKHISLNWAPADEVSRDHMIATAESFLNHMGWGDHQAILFAHNDKEYQHLHIVLNAIHPETGLKLDDSLEKVRAQDWALAYERENDRIHCAQRLVAPEEREPSPSRSQWQVLKDLERAYEQDEQYRRFVPTPENEPEPDRPLTSSEEWTLLKAHQRSQREAFYAEGKTAYGDARKQAYFEVREEFRNEWADYYEAKRDGEDRDYLAAIREDILDRQGAALTERGQEACDALRAQRDAWYAELLESQKADRAELRARQHECLESPELRELDNQNPQIPGKGGAAPEPDVAVGIDVAFRSAADEVCEPGLGLFRADHEARADGDESAGDTSAADARVRGAEEVASSIGEGLLGGLAAIAERLFDGFFGGSTPKADPNEPQQSRPPPEPVPEFPPENPFQRVAEAARLMAEQEEQEMREREWWDERERVRD